MTFLDYLFACEIYIDFGEEIFYGSDQVNLTHPIRFPTVTFQLMDTSLLSRIADLIRTKKGYRPMQPIENWKEEDCDQSGWYDFYIGLNGLNQIDNSIEFVVVSSDAPDNEQIYHIDLSEEERSALLGRLDKQCLKYLNKSCFDLLNEARAKMEEDYGC